MQHKMTQESLTISTLTKSLVIIRMLKIVLSAAHFAFFLCKLMYAGLFICLNQNNSMNPNQF